MGRGVPGCKSKLADEECVGRELGELEEVCKESNDDVFCHMRKGAIPVLPGSVDGVNRKVIKDVH